MNHRQKLDKLLADRRHLALKVKEETAALRDATAHLKNVGEAQSILQSIAKAVEDQAHRRISKIVTKCLRVVFDDPYEFRIIFEHKRGKVDARLAFFRDGLLLENPADEAGGGVLDVASFALRLACLILAKPARRRVLFLDEPFRYVDEVNQERIGQLLLTLSSELGVQIIQITHSEALKIGKVIKL